MPLTGEQSHAMQVFDKTCGKITSDTYIVFALGAILSLIGQASIQGVVWLMGVVLMSLAGVYLLVLLLVMRIQTSLIWHFTASRSNWFGTLIMIVLYLVWIMPLVLAGSRQIAGLILLDLLVVPSLLRLLLSEVSKQRAESEGDRYGEHWPKLASLSFRDILFLRIPHERA